jgi:hypothetical protein
MITPLVIHSDSSRGASSGQAADKQALAETSFAALLNTPALSPGRSPPGAAAPPANIAEPSLPPATQDPQASTEDGSGQPVASGMAADVMLKADKPIRAPETSGSAMPAIAVPPGPAQQASEPESNAEPAAIGSQALRQRTFGFSDLGAFGLQFFAGDRAGVPNAAGGEAKSSGSPVSSSDGSAYATPQSDNPGQSQPPLPTRLAGAVVSPPADAPSGSRTAPFASLLRGALPGQNAAQNPETDAASEEAGNFFDKGGAGKILPIAPGRPSPVNLAVSGPNNMLAVAVRAQGGAVQDALKLRQLFDATAAEFDMKIGDLQFNGSPSQPFARGDANGGRTR